MAECKALIAVYALDWAGGFSLHQVGRKGLQFDYNRHSWQFSPTDQIFPLKLRWNESVVRLNNCLEFGVFLTCFLKDGKNCQE